MHEEKHHDKKKHHEKKKKTAHHGMKHTKEALHEAHMHMKKFGG